MPTLSHIGPLTRHPRDAARMLNVIGRYDYRDPYATRGQPEDWGVDLDCDLRGLRIAYSADLGYADVDPQIAARVKEAAQKLEALGAEIVEIHPGFESPIETFRAPVVHGLAGGLEPVRRTRQEAAGPGAGPQRQESPELDRARSVPGAGTSART